MTTKTKAASIGGEAALNKTVQQNHIKTSDLVQAMVQSGEAGKAAVAPISRMSDPDHLYSALFELLPDTLDLLTLIKIRGFMRQIQKVIERGAA